jgi:Rrf2 family protein
VRVSQKLEYACRAVVCLARHYDGSTVVKLEDIAQREDISSSFLVQILNELKRSDIVTSKRGKAGGYVLTRRPAKVSLREVVQAVEPGLLATPENSSGASNTVSERLGAITLEVMASEAGAPMYFI